MNSEQRPIRSHRSWIPVAILLLALFGAYYLNQQDRLDRNFRAWMIFGDFVLTILLLLLWFLFLSRLRWTTRGLGLLAVIALGVVARQTIRVESAIDGRGLLKLAWRWSPTKDEISAANFAKHPPSLQVAGSTNPLGADFSQFLGPDRRNELTNITLDRHWMENPPKLLWRQPIGLGWSAFSVLRGRAVTQEQRGDGELVTCYDIRSGAPYWSHTNQARFSEIQGGDGPRATPTLFENQVYAMGATGILDCLELDTGRLIWSRQVLELTKQSNLMWGKSCSPLVVDDLVVVTGGRGSGPTVLAFRRSTGDLVWSAGDEEASYASPSLVTLEGHRQILSLNARKVIALEPSSGKLLWEYEWAPKAKWPRSSQVIAFGNSKVFFSAGYGLGSAVLTIHLSENGTWTTTEDWAVKTMKTQFNNVSILNGFVYGIDDGFMACVDLIDGTRKWKDGRYGSGQSLLVGDVLVVQHEDGNIVLVEASPSGWKELGTLPALSSKTWNNPVVANPYLLVRNDVEAACYELPRPEGAVSAAR